MLFCYNDFYVLVLALASLAGCMAAAVQCVRWPPYTLYDDRRTMRFVSKSTCWFNMMIV